MIHSRVGSNDVLSGNQILGHQQRRLASVQCALSASTQLLLRLLFFGVLIWTEDLLICFRIFVTLRFTDPYDIFLVFCKSCGTVISKVSVHCIIVREGYKRLKLGQFWVDGIVWGSLDYSSNFD